MDQPYLPGSNSTDRPLTIDPMIRPQFTIKTLLWLLAVVAAFCAGILFERQRENTRWTVEIGGEKIDVRNYVLPGPY
jgi:hypothetical protein